MCELHRFPRKKQWLQFEVLALPFSEVSYPSTRADSRDCCANRLSVRVLVTMECSTNTLLCTA
jgi:hypothetical protein